ncbi:Abc transporter b family member 25 [Globisporangium polare]
MSDGISGMVIHNDLLTIASELSRNEQQENPDAKQLVQNQKQLPLRPSLNDLWMRPKPIKSFLSKLAIKLFGKMIFADEIKAFNSLIPVRADQKDLGVPVKTNTSSAYFGLGSAENLKKTLGRCKREGVTLFCACAAAVIASYYLPCGDDDADEKRNNGSPFKVTVDFPFNMRRRVETPAQEVQVGCYSATNSLESFGKEGVAMDAVRFWDLARKTRRELDELLQSMLLPLPYLFLDDHLTAKTKPAFFKGFEVPQSITADIDISNTGKYAYETKHAFQTEGDKLEELVIDCVHVSNSNPHIGSALGIFIASTDKLSYGFMHKYEHARGKQLCDAMVASIEHIGRVETHETMLDVAHAVQQQQRAL